MHRVFVIKIEVYISSFNLRLIIVSLLGCSTILLSLASIKTDFIFAQKS